MGQPFKDQVVSDSIVDLDRHHAPLEENVSKLQKSLKYWQTSEAEYEGLKEEILGLGDEHKFPQLKKACDEFEGEVVNQKEIKLLLKDAQGHQRTSPQIIGLLNRRIEYVRNNVNSVTSLLLEAETKNAASLAINQEVSNDEGLPLREIREDLDDEDNIISSSITSPSDAAPQVIEVLRKTGLEGLPESKVEKKGVAKSASDGAISNQPKGIKGCELDLAPAGVKDEVESTVSRADMNASIRRKKSVSFAEGTKEGDATIPKNNNAVSREQKAKMTYLKKLLRPGLPAEEIANKVCEELERSAMPNTQKNKRQRIKQSHGTNGGNHSFPQDSKSISSKPAVNTPSPELKNEEKSAKPFSATIPTDETAEDAALRRQMIQYNMAEVGAVVAEIVLDEDDSDGWTDDDDHDAWTDDDELNESSAEEDEDQYGRTKRRVVGEDYRREMLALEEKLNVKSIRNIGPGGNTSLIPRKGPEHDSKVNSIIDEDGASPKRKSSPIKEVRFADLQIQDDASHKHPSASSSNVQTSPLPVPPSTKKASISRFKAERINSPPLTTPKPPTSIIASSILERPYNPIPPSSTPPPMTPKATTSEIISERPYNPTPSSHPAPPSTEDPALVHQQLTTEYHRLRNRMIYRQGGFLADDDKEEEVAVEVVGENADEDERDARLGQPHQDSRNQGGTKKMSRFRAARLKGLP